jgi:hypothetical protein
MPGAPFMHSQPTFQDVAGEGIRPAAPDSVGSHLFFILWLIILGVVVPAAIFGGLRFAGFQFIFKSR